MSDTKKHSTQLVADGCVEAVVASSFLHVLALLPFVLSLVHGILRCIHGGNAWDVVCSIFFPGFYSMVAGIIDYRDKYGRGFRGAAEIAKEIEALKQVNIEMTKAGEEFIRSMQF